MKFLVSMLLTLLLITPKALYAQDLSNSEVRLELNPSPKTEKQKKEDVEIYKTISKTVNNQHDKTFGDKFTVTIPYFDDYNKLPLGITLSSENINFGKVTSGEPIVRTQKINIFSKGKKGYSVFTAQNHGLSSSSNIQIPNTSCDSGSCTSVLSDKWNLPLTYGFGYTCENRETCNDSLQEGLYRRFASLESDESYAVILNGIGTTETNIVYKLNISPTQAEDSYNNTVYYILTPHL